MRHVHWAAASMSRPNSNVLGRVVLYSSLASPSSPSTPRVSSVDWRWLLRCIICPLLSFEVWWSTKRLSRRLQALEQ